MPTEISGSTGVNKIQDGTVVDADINSSAAIAGSKLVMPTGSVLQVVYSSYTTALSSTSTTFVETGASAVITPSSTSSKILIQISQHMGLYDNDSDTGCGYKIDRNGTDVWSSATAYDSYAYTSGGDASEMRGRVFLQYLDSPNSTSALTYKTFMKNHSSGAFRAQQNSNPTMFVLMEIAG